MGFFTKKETHKVKDIEVTIIDKTSSKFRDKAKAAIRLILEILEQNPKLLGIVERLKIKFILQDKIKTRSFRRLFGLESGAGLADLRKQTIAFSLDQELDRTVLNRILDHEIGHFWHDANSEFNKTTEAIITKIHAKFQRHTRKELLQLKKNLGQKGLLKNLRESVAQFYTNIVSEGIAEFFSQLDKPDKITDQQIMYIHKRAMAHALAIMQSIDYILKEKEAGKMIDAVIKTNNELCEKAYPIGFHVVSAYFLLQRDKSFLEIAEDLKKIRSYHQLVLKYERLMKKYSLKPVVSLTSGRGIIDYKSVLNKINRTFKDFS